MKASLERTIGQLGNFPAGDALGSQPPHIDTSFLPEMGVQRGAAPFAGSVRVSLT